MRVFCLFLTCLLVPIMSCAQKEYVLDKTFTYHVSTDVLYEELKFEDIFEEYRCIALKQSPEYMIGTIKQVLQYKDRVIVVSNGIYCFDFDGNPLYNITNRGHAKNEYIDCVSVSLCDDLLYMYDRGKLQIHVYDASTGNHLQNLESPCVETIY